MTAGVPGLGLSGLFALLAALCIPLLHPSRRHGWGRLVAMALVIAVAAVLAWRGVTWLYSAISPDHSTTGPRGVLHPGQTVGSDPAVGELFGVPVIVVSFGLLLGLLLAGEVLYRVLGVRPTSLPPPIPAPAPAAGGALPAGSSASTRSPDVGLQRPRPGETVMAAEH